MSKTFKCVEHEEEVLEVYPFTGEEGGRKFSLLMPHVSSNAGIAFDSTTAPALALAILEAAGHRPVAYDPERLSGDDLLAYIAHRLAVHVGDEAKRTAEAEAQAKLEAEALDYWKAYNRAVDPANFDDVQWGDLMPATQSKWLAVARKAREMAKEAGE